MKLEPTPAQVQVLWALANLCRRTYNYALFERQFLYKVYHVNVTYQEQQNALPQFKEQYPEYKWVYSKVLQMTLKKLDGGYQSYLTKRRKGDLTAHPPNFRGRRYFFTLCYNQSGFKVQSGVLTLSHKHPSNIPLAFTVPLDIKGTIKQVEVSQDYKGRWFVTITTERPPTKPYRDNGQYQAIDVGVINLVAAVNLQGKFTQVKNKRPEKYWRPKMAEVQAKRDRCKKHSRRWHWYNRKLARMVRKQAHQLRDFHHKISKVVVTHTRANTLIVGDLNVKQMAGQAKPGNPHHSKAQKTLHYALQNTGHLGRFITFLDYKAARIGKRVIRLDEAWTSQVCCQCGAVAVRPLATRVISCPCGLTLDRDLNAAVNLLVKFLLRLDPASTLWQQSVVNTEPFHHRWPGFLRYTANRQTKVPLLSQQSCADS
ncbi:MAG: RNA-guided endonuclease InsQ/TnpB family protein [Candidatus Hermodarchaeota archaeon]